MPDVQIFRARAIGYTPGTAIPSMTSADEKALYFDVARSYGGRGAVIEIGSWLGSSTFEICRGLDASGRDWRLTVIDRFRWSDLYERSYPGIALRDGESFLPLFRQNLTAYADRIDCIEAELKDLPTVFAPPERIELLFVDAPKSWGMLWTVLDLLAPCLVVGARLVFQDFLHITSRQLIWLLASIPQLRPVHVVDSGTAASFELQAPITDLAATAPRSIAALGVADLLRLWRQACDTLPAARAGEISIGMALDLLRLRADDAAERVLETARRSPDASALLASVERLVRFSDKANRRPLIEVAAFLRAGIRPAEARAAWASLDEEDAANADGPENGPLRDMSSEGLAALAKTVRRPRGAKALALSYAVHNGAGKEDLVRLMPLFAAAVTSGAAVQAAEVQEHALGRDVLELNAGATLHGVALRALGARSYLGVDSRYDPGQRTYTGAVPSLRHRTTIRLGDVPALLPGFSFLGAGAAIPPASADLVIVETRRVQQPVEELLDMAVAALRPGGRICLRWRNPFAWSGHGRRPQRPEEADRSDPEQAEVMDWRHLRALRRPLPTLSQLRRLIEERLVIEGWGPRLEDPAVVLRLREKVLQAYPGLSPADLLTRDVTVLARPRAAQEERG